MLTQLRFELSKLNAEQYRAVQAHRTLRDRMASLVTGDPLPISTPVVSIDPVSEAAPNDFDPALPSRKRLREVVPSRAPPVPNRVTRSSISTP